MKNPALIVSGPLHGNEPTAVGVIEHLNRFPVPGVQTYLAHHEAYAQGVRFQGTTELGSHFPGDFRSHDPEDRVAARMVSDVRAMPHWLGLDIHDVSIPNSNYLAVGGSVTREQLGVALVLGISNVLVEATYAFFSCFPQFVTIETTRDPTSNFLSQPAYWEGRIRQIAGLGVQGLRDIFEREGDKLSYFTRISIPLSAPKVLTRFQVQQLEQISFGGEAFEKVTLPFEIAEALGVGKRPTRIGTWNYQNNSRERRELGATTAGVWRREVFGSVLVEIPRPTLQD